MKKNLEILDYEDKKTTDGKRYVRFKTSDGWMSCFDAKQCELLKKFEGKIAYCDIVESGKFKNIKKCYGEESDEDVEEVEVEKPGESGVPKRGTNNHATMYTSYAKDIFCAMISSRTENTSIETYMNQAIELVKQAKEAFE